MKNSGALITIEGINGIGKTTQSNLLVKFLHSRGKEAYAIKYPMYDLEPEGPFLYAYLRDPSMRKKENLTVYELQEKFMQNRKRHRAQLHEEICKGKIIVAEDYTYTGITWGLTWGGNLEHLTKMTEGLLKADVALLLDGEQFRTAIEEGHLNETNKEKIEICRSFFCF